MRLAVVGSGRVGLAVLKAARDAGDEVVLIESDPERVRRARTRFGVISVVDGDATEEATLRAAGVPDRVDALVATTPDDPTNMMVCSLARRLGLQNVVARVSDEDATELYAEAGVTTVQNPSHLTAEYLYRAFEVPDVRAFMPVGEDVEVISLALNARHKLANAAVRDANFPANALLIAVNRHGRVLVPHGDLILKEGDTLTLVAPSRQLDKIVNRILRKPQRLAEKVWDIVRGG